MNGGHNVIERLDSLVLGTPLSSLEAEVASQTSGCSSGSNKSGILKDVNRDRSSPDKKRGITFPDYEELQEIIGYGGDMYYSSEEEDAKEPDGKSGGDYTEELTQEERNVLNITKKNTSFNSHPQNLKDPGGAPMPKLGVDKKHTPIISVRPFVRDVRPGKVNMVPPMVNGEIVTKPKAKEEAKMIKKDSLGSDGSTENSSSDSDSTTRDSPSPTEPVAFVEFDTAKNNDTTAGGELYKKQQSFLGSQIEEQKAKSSAASARLSFLNSYSAPKSDVSALKVKPSNYMDDADSPAATSPPQPSAAKLSLLNVNSSPSAEAADTRADNKKQDKVSLNMDRKLISSPASARLSFLNSTIGGLNKSLSTPPGPDTNIAIEAAAAAVKLDRNVSSRGAVGSVAAAESVSSQISGDNGDQHPDKNGPAEKVGSSRSDSCKDSPKVKLTRKSPYVVGPFASTSILKGTPKPMITRKPPILKDKPKVPLKPNKLMMRSPSSSPSPSPLPVDRVDSVDSDEPGPGVKTPADNDDHRPSPSPVAAPRKASFSQKSEHVSVKTAAGVETKLEETSSITVTRPGEKESETSAGGGDRNNSLIISVSSARTMPHDDPPTVTTSDSGSKTETTESAEGSVNTSNQSNQSENSPPQVQKNLVNKNKEALEAIRKSLSNKLISSAPPQLVMESIKASEGFKEKSLFNKPSAEKSASNSFEENRASIADALQFNRHDNVARPSTKRQAPRPPDADSDEADETFDNCQNESKDDPSNEITTEEVSNDPEVSAEPKLTPAIRNSSMKSEHSSKNKDSKPRTVQFSPETVTVTVPSSSNATPKLVSYNRWVGNNKYNNHYLESSFTGQPITMYPPGVITPQMKAQNGVRFAPAPTPVVDEGPRKWTEKKGKWRSKSTPRSSEIDEIIGSSKTKSQNRLAIFTPSSPQPIKRQSRVEIYESEKRGVQKKGKFSLKKLFKIQGLPENMEEGAAGDNKFIDKEHEREILERKVKARPEIIHPLDLMNSGVEMVKITPKNSIKGHYDKHKSSRSGEKSAVKRHADMKGKSDSDSKDSGHDTASIHTETSSEHGSSSGSGDASHSSSGAAADFSPGLTPVGVVSVVPPPPPPPLHQVRGDVSCLAYSELNSLPHKNN